MTLVLREATPADAQICGRICYEAFTEINAHHNFPPEFPDVETPIGLLSMMFAHPGFYAVVAERRGVVIGSNVLDERSTIAGIGPISVAPQAQNSGAGRELMLHVMERAKSRHFPGVRLVQAAFHNRSLSLYARLGFDAREPLSCMKGPPIGTKIPGYPVRQATQADQAACNQLCLRVHGHERGGELRDAIEQGATTVVEHAGCISGYATGIGYFAHAVGETDRDLQALLAAVPSFVSPGFLLPTRNAEMFRWCLANRLRVVHPMMLMTLGLYNEPQGAYLPSILY